MQFQAKMEKDSRKSSKGKHILPNLCVIRFFRIGLIKLEKKVFERDKFEIAS